MADRPVEIAAIVGVHALGGDVGAIDGEAHDHLGQRLAEAGERVVAGRPALLRKPVQLVGQDVELAVERVAEDVRLRGDDRLLVVDLAPGEAVIGGGEGALGARIDEQAADQRHELVAGRTGDRQVLAQVLKPGEDLFDDEVDRGAEVRLEHRLAPSVCDRRCRLLEQPAAVARGIVQAIDVIEPQPLHLVLGDQAQDHAVGLLEHLGALHPEPGQLVDVEEAAVVDVRAGDAPEGEAVDLIVEQAMERAKALGLAGGAVDRRDGGLDRRPARRIGGRDRGQVLLEGGRLARGEMFALPRRRRRRRGWRNPRPVG